MEEEPMVYGNKKHKLAVDGILAVVAKTILTINTIVEKLFTPRSIYTLMFFGTLCYMLLNDKEIPQVLNTICTALLAFYFGEKNAKYQMEVMKNGKTKTTTE